MVIRPGALPELWKLLARKPYPFTESLAAYQYCPACCQHHVPLDQRTMRIFVPLEDEFLFRCTRCQGCYDALELTRRTRKLETFEEAASLLWEAGILAERCTSREITRHERIDHLTRAFERGRSFYAHFVEKKLVAGRAFGDWAAMTWDQLSLVWPGSDLPRGQDRAHHLVQRLRNPFGRPSSMVLCHLSHIPIGRLSLWTKEPIELATVPWLPEVDLDQVILASSSKTAGRLQHAVAKWPREERLAVIYAERIDAPAISYRQPFSRVWHVLRDDEEAAEGLAFLRPHETEVHCKRIKGNEADPIDRHERLERHALCRDGLPDSLTVTAARIIHGERTNLGNRLQRIFRQRYIADTTKRELLEKCAELSGKPVLALIEEGGFDASPYAVRRNGKTFVCRNGIYLMQDRKGRWQRISNFSLKMMKRAVDGNGDATYELLLNVEDQPASFTVTSAVLNDPLRLWVAALRCGALAGIPDLDMPNAQHRQLLPSLVKVSRGLLMAGRAEGGGRAPADPGGQRHEKKGTKKSESL